MKHSKKSFFDSLTFKSWLYFMLFALSMLLLLLFFQIILLEPMYMRNLRQEMVDMTDRICEISFSGMAAEEKAAALTKLTAENNACIVIYNQTSGSSTAYDVLGESGCAIYGDGTVNPEILDAMDHEPSDSLFIEDKVIENSSQAVMIYGRKAVVDDQTYYVLANETLQPVDNLIRVSQKQYVLIAAIILGLSVIISYFFSGVLTRPIVKMTSEAAKLSEGNYNVHFEKEGITELDDLADTLNLAAQELSVIDTTDKELMANVSHDLKTPLTMIKAYAEMIRDISGGNKKKRDEHLEVIIQETDYLNKMVTDMLNLSKLQAGAVVVDIKPFDLSTNVQNTVVKFKTIAGQEGVTIDVQCEPELMAYGDESRIDEVLYNFISNALNHYGADKLVIVKAFLKNKDTVRVEVIDHGPGIDEKVLPYIWDRYYKNDKQYVRAQSGSGLGLAINKAILEDHHAEYGVITEKGRGSTFFFELKAVTVD